MVGKGEDGDIWQRLRVLAKAFADASIDERSKDVEDVAIVLSALRLDEGFRGSARAAWEAYNVKQYGMTRSSQKFATEFLLFLVERAIDDGPEMVAQVIVDQAAIDVTILCHVRGSLDVGRVTEAIRPKMADPGHEDAEAVIRAAMRALDADPNYVRNMFQVSS